MTGPTVAEELDRQRRRVLRAALALRAERHAPGLDERGLAALQVVRAVAKVLRHLRRWLASQ